MFPPWTSGGIVDSGPAAGATPITPQNGARGSRIPGMKSIGPLGAESSDVVRRVRELVGEEPEPGDDRRPAPARRLEVEQVDLERVARLGAVDRDRPADLVDAIEVQGEELGHAAVGIELAAARVEQIELDDAARVDRRDRLDRRVPRQVVAIAGHMDRGGGDHGGLLRLGSSDDSAVTRQQRVHVVGMNATDFDQFP